jgi:hypothetical protein
MHKGIAKRSWENEGLVGSLNNCTGVLVHNRIQRRKHAFGFGVWKRGGSFGL